MNVPLRITTMLVSAVAILYFTFWVGGALLLSEFPHWVTYLVSLVAALLVAISLWILTDQRRSGLFAYIVVGALGMGGISFCAGFFGPVLLAPGANQGPLLGFITGPLGFVLGVVGGAVYWLIRRRRTGPSTA
jgi:hypothetical protein